MEELEKVRAALRLLGAAVVERPMPAILTGGERSFYSPSKHTVVLATGAPQTTLWHELAHSQQPAKAVAYYRTDGSVDAALWMSDPREREAWAVELLVPLLDRGADAVVAALRLLGEDDAIFASAIAQPLVLAKWVEHVLAGAVDAPKPHVARRTRRAINALTGAPSVALLAGADVNAKDVAGWTALMWAEFSGHTQIAEMLRATQEQRETQEAQSPDAAPDAPRA